jgi:hypothetical protein
MPGLLEASLKHFPVTSGLRRHGTLPSSLLKRTDSLLFTTGTNYVTEKNVPSSNKDSKFETKTGIQLTNIGVQSKSFEKNFTKEFSLEPIYPRSPCPSTTSYIPTSSTLSSINAINNLNLLNEINERKKMKSNERAKFKSKIKKDENNLDVDGLKRQIFKLKDYIYYLEAENCSLLKDKKVKKILYSYDVDKELTVAKAKPESDFDEYKV